jgi:hypothetical protein
MDSIVSPPTTAYTGAGRWKALLTEATLVSSRSATSLVADGLGPSR